MHSFLSMVYLRFNGAWILRKMCFILNEKTFNLRAGDKCNLKRKTWFHFSAATPKNATQMQEFKTAVAINYSVIVKI